MGTIKRALARTIIYVKFDYISSLGSNCEMAYNLRHYFSGQSSSLLDWTITPISCLPKLIESNFTLVDEKFSTCLSHVELENDHDSIMHNPTGILLHHAFPRGGEHDRIVGNWQEYIPEVISKFTYLQNKLNTSLKKSARSLLFVNRSGQHSALPEQIAEEMINDQIYVDILTSLQKNYGDCYLAIMNGDPHKLSLVKDNRYVRIDEVKNFGIWHEGHEGHFAGCAKGWNETLDSIGMSLL